MPNLANHSAPTSHLVIGYFEDYAAASAAVERLARLGAPIEHLSIVGEGVQYVEDVIGKRTVGRSLLDGAAAGGTVGLATGLFFAWVDWLDPSVDTGSPVLSGFLVGAILGALVGTLWHVLRLNGTRISVVNLQAHRYRVEADDPVIAERASRQLGTFVSRR
jgi:hypothetical protein